jgi:hypothetical protein
MMKEVGMNHDDYEAMIFAEEPLPPTARFDLQTHLQGCEACRSLAAGWQGVQSDLESTDEVEPRTGFTDRWEARLQGERVRVHRRQVSAVLGFSLGGALILILALAAFWFPVLEAPKVYLYAFLYQALNMFIAANLVQGMLVGLVRSTSSPVSFMAWIVLFGVICQLAVLWLVSLRLATKTRSV